MKEYYVTGYRTVTMFEKVYFAKVEADSEEQAIALASSGEVSIDDCKILDYKDATFKDVKNWSAKEA